MQFLRVKNFQVVSSVTLVTAYSLMNPERAQKFCFWELIIRIRSTFHGDELGNFTLDRCNLYFRVATQRHRRQALGHRAEANRIWPKS